MQDATPAAENDRTARLRAAFERAGVKPERRPTRQQLEAAARTLAWLSADTDDGALRDQIGSVRHALLQRAAPRDLGDQSPPR